MLHLLKLIQKPTVQRFYDNLKDRLPASIQQLSWSNLKNKMNYSKKLYTQAINWRNNTGNGILVENGSITVEGNFESDN